MPDVALPTRTSLTNHFTSEPAALTMNLSFTRGAFHDDNIALKIGTPVSTTVVVTPLLIRSFQFPQAFPNVFAPSKPIYLSGPPTHALPVDTPVTNPPVEARLLACNPM